MMIKAALTLLLLLMSPLAHADIAGQEDPAYLSARDLWLDGADAAALPQLAALAQDGNTAAQILLGRIQPRSHMHRHVTGDMTRKERIVLMRQQVGLSGTNWLKAAAKSEPLAQAFLDGNRLETMPRATLALLDLGEPLASLVPTMNLINHGKTKAAKAALTHPAMPHDYAAQPRFILSTFPGKLRLPPPPLAQQLIWKFPNLKALINGDPIRPEVTKALWTLKQAAPLRAFCTLNCPMDPKNCTLAVSTVLRLKNPLALSTPTETLVPQSVYDDSPRITDDLRRIAQSLPISVATVSSLDSCAAETLGMK